MPENSNKWPGNVLPVLIVCLLAVACSPGPQLAVPDRFKDVAEKSPIKGANSFGLNQKLSFGPYRTSRVNRGWTGSAASAHYSAEQRLLQLFDIDNHTASSIVKNKYHYSISDGAETIQVFCLEQMWREEMKLNIGSGKNGGLSRTKSSDYSFTAGLVPESYTNATPWQLLMHSVYDRKKDTARRLFDLPYKAEVGYATNGIDTIEIRPLRIRNMVNRKGENKKYPVQMLSGFELRIDDGVIAVIDRLGNNFWVYRELDVPTRRVAAAICSAMMLRTLDSQNE